MPVKNTNCKATSNWCQSATLTHQKSHFITVYVMLAACKDRIRANYCFFEETPPQKNNLHILFNSNVFLFSVIGIRKASTYVFTECVSHNFDIRDCHKL